MKKYMKMLLPLVLTLFLTGCAESSREKRVPAEQTVWFLNEEGDGLVAEAYDDSDQEAGAELDTILNLFRRAPENAQYSALLPPEVTINSVVLEDGLLTLDFSKAYEEMDPIREVLARAGIVRTLVQLDNVKRVHFTTEGSPTVSPGGMELGVMNEDSFIEDAGKQINATQHTTINLYFADETGQYLKRESRSIYFSANKTLEWAIVERIIAGPKLSGSYSTVPSTTQIISVSSANGVCYVNLTQSFVNNALGVKEMIPIYSIVDSIIDNSRDITSVQISIEGNSDIMFRQSVDLAAPFEANFDLVMAQEEEN